ncbi:MAG: glycosyltransferase family 2 protein [Saprospiraceae bacterium]
MTTLPLTVIVTTYNEEANISRCLGAVREWAREILVVDSFSTDDTVKQAQALGARILQRTYQGPADQKNWVIPQASQAWILLLDADEVPTPALMEEIAHLLRRNVPPSEDMYWIGRDNFFMGQPVRFSGWQGDKVVRFFHRDKARYNDLQVHEEIVTQGFRVGMLKGRLQHYTFRTLSHYLAKTERYARWSAQDHATRTPVVRGYHLVGKPFFRFFKHFVLQQGFRDGKTGLIVSAIMAWGVFLRYAFIQEIQQTNSQFK